MSPGLAGHVARNDDDGGDNNNSFGLDGLLLRAGLFAAVYRPLRRNSTVVRAELCPHGQYLRRRRRRLGDRDANKRRLRAGVVYPVADD